MNISQALHKVVDREDLSQEQMHKVVKQIMTGQAGDAQIGAFLTALRMKGESLDEITAAAQVMRELVTPVSLDLPYLVDTCGTGGDGANIFNVSTAAAFVAAAQGAHVAKHGNRSVSSSTGSADVLEAAGINLAMTPEQVARAVETTGVGFMFAPAHHGAMKHAIKARKELGMRTIFNMLGPLTNPAGVKRQVVGVFDKSLCRPMAEVLGRLGSEHALVVHSDDGLDEFSVAGNNWVAEWKDNLLTEYSVDPSQFGLREKSLDVLSVQSAEQSLEVINAAFDNQTTALAKTAAAIIALNAGAAIYVSGLASSLKEGVAMAEDGLASGGAKQKLVNLRDFSACV